MDKNTALAALNNFELNATVGLDDVVNVFISRYETACHTQFAEVQGRLKENGQKLKALELEARTKVKEDFITPDEIIGRTYMFETKQTFDNITIEWAGKTVMIGVVHTTTALNHAKIVGYGQSTTSINTFNIRVNLHENFVGAYNRLTEEGAAIREELMLVNQQLQQVDRKARQVKGFIAERKLEQAGMSALLENSELAQLIRIG